MIPILYESTETNFTSNGLGRLRDCLTCEVTEERNGIFELDFTYPVDGANFDLIQPGRIVAVTHDDTGQVEPFDIVGFTKPIGGIVTFHAVHISYRLSYAVAWNRNINSLTEAMAWLTAINTPFSFAGNFDSNGYLAAADGVPRSVRQLLGGIEGSILDTYGGEYRFHGWRVSLYKARGKARDLTIRYGVNLIDYNEEADYQGTYTSVVPYWTGTDGAKQVVVRGARVDSTLTPFNGRRQVIPLDLTDKFEDKPTAAQLETAAATYMTANQTNLPAQNISVDFYRLQDTPEYADLANLMTCELCDTVEVAFPRYNMSGRFKIVKIVWNVLEERFSSMELGNLSTSLADALGISTSAGSYATDDDLGVGGDLTVGGTITAGGKITAGGRLVLPYNTYLAAKDGDGNEQGMLNFYSNHEYFGNNSFPTTIRGTSINISNAIAGFYKVTQVSVSVAAINAHSNISGTSQTMTAQSGFNAVGIVGWSTSNYRIRPTTHYIASNTSLYAGFANTSATNVTSTTSITFYVLWLKATSA